MCGLISGGQYPRAPGPARTLGRHDRRICADSVDRVRTAGDFGRGPVAPVESPVRCCNREATSWH